MTGNCVESRNSLLCYQGFHRDFTYVDSWQRWRSGRKNRTLAVPASSYIAQHYSRLAQKKSMALLKAALVACEVNRGEAQRGRDWNEKRRHIALQTRGRVLSDGHTRLNIRQRQEQGTYRRMENPPCHEHHKNSTKKQSDKSAGNKSDSTSSHEAGVEEEKGKTLHTRQAESIKEHHS